MPRPRDEIQHADNLATGRSMCRAYVDSFCKTVTIELGYPDVSGGRSAMAATKRASVGSKLPRGASNSNDERRRAHTAVTELLAHGRAWAKRHRARYDPTLADQDLEDAVQTAVVAVYQQGDASSLDAMQGLMRRCVGRTLRGAARRQQRRRELDRHADVASRAVANQRIRGDYVDQDALVGAVVKGRRRSSKRSLVKLERGAAEALAAALAKYERLLAHSIATGILVEDGRYERFLYEHGISLIERDWALQPHMGPRPEFDTSTDSGRDEEPFLLQPLAVVRPLPDGRREAIIAAMVCYRRGLEGGLATTRGRGRPRAHVAARSVTTVNGRALAPPAWLRHERFASDLTTHLLGQCGMDPDIKHFWRRTRDKRVSRTIAQLRSEHELKQRGQPAARRPWWMNDAPESKKRR